MRRLLLLLAFCSLTAAACGGTQPTPTPTPGDSQSEAPIQREMAPVLQYEVYWDDIHVLTLYGTAGPLRSEESGHPDDVFSGRSSYVTASSHYFEREPQMIRIIEAASSMDELLVSLANAGYECELSEPHEGL
ncbi:MAG: hypothetical protein KC561_02290 [Myxococcales bacterium]|nr:hypothetical protein [Myxococcales bacterium]